MNPALDILLVEDDAVFASVLARSLQRRGHRVVLAADVVQARERLSGQAFTHAILDLELAQESLRAGKISLLEFNVVRRDLVDTRLGYLDALADLVEARSALELAAGGSWE